MFVFSATLGTALAAASYELLEQPVRTAVWLRARSAVSLAMGITSAVLVGLIISPFLLHQPAAAEVRPITADGPVTGSETAVPELDWGAIKDDVYPVGQCIKPDASDCLLRSGSSFTVFVMGDSHAQMWTPAVMVLADRYDWTVYEGRIFACPWAYGIFRGPPDRNGVEACRDRRPLQYQHLEAVDPDLVVLVENGITQAGADSLGAYDSSYDGLQGELLLKRAMGDSLETIRELGSEVLLIEPVPNVVRNPLDCLAGAEFVEQCAFEPLEGSLEELIYREFAEQNVSVGTLDVDGIVCDDLCPAMIDGVVVRRDQSHFTVTFAAGLADELDHAIEMIRR